MSKIIITRNSEWNNRMREIRLYVDGKKLEGIKNGDVKTFELPEGTHTLQAKIDWCSSRELPFTLAANETKYFRLSGFKYANIIMPLAAFLIVANLLLKRVAGINYTLYLAIPAFLVLVYYLTLGRKDYLRLAPADSW